MSNFFAELRRRRVLRTLALYILGAWGLMQVADVLLPGLGLPEESIRYLLFTAIGGFPVALIFGWFFDISADGIQRTAPLGDGESIAALPLRTTDYVLLGALAVVLGLIAYGIVGGVVSLPQTGQPSVETERDVTGPPMVGVLPFEHMGSNEDGKFFAIGIHDDLLTRLAKIQGLRVLSRTSVLAYAGTTKKIPQIGRELRADAILEGGVRIAGSQIRINAQLIDARQDEHLWAETYDRELTADNIFAVQADIARAIAAALRTTLNPSDRAELTNIPTSNMGAYRAFHEINQWRETVHLDDDNRDYYVAGLEKAFALDPNFTRPMVELVGTLALQFYGERNREQLPRIEGLIDRIAAIAPDSADLLTAQSFYFYYVLRDFERADVLIEKAQQRAPSDTRLLEIQSYIKRRQGDWEGYLDTAFRARALDPQSIKLNYMVVTRLMTLHRYEAALEELEEITIESSELDLLRAMVKLWEHGDLARYAADLEALLAAEKDPQAGSFLHFLLWEAHLAQGNYAKAGALIDQMPPLPADVPLPLKHLPPTLLPKIVQSIYQDDDASLAAYVERAFELLGVTGSDPAGYPDSLNLEERALLALASGHRDYAIALLDESWNDPDWDRADWLLSRIYHCEVLGMAQAAKAATACLRNALTEPSRTLTYLAPYSPSYDGFRDSEEFRRLMQDLVDQGQIKTIR